MVLWPPRWMRSFPGAGFWCTFGKVEILGEVMMKAAMSASIVSEKECLSS
jgi:hypothetical protein